MSAIADELLVVLDDYSVDDLADAAIAAARLEGMVNTLTAEPADLSPAVVARVVTAGCARLSLHRDRAERARAAGNESQAVAHEVIGAVISRSSSLLSSMIGSSSARKKKV